MAEGKKFTLLGEISFILAIISLLINVIGFIIFSNAIKFAMDTRTSCNFAIAIGFSFGILSIIAMTLGAITYNKEKDRIGLFALFIGFISLLFGGFLFFIGIGTGVS